jgi:alpha-1,2-glucosyltransferase
MVSRGRSCRPCQFHDTDTPSSPDLVYAAASIAVAAVSNPLAVLRRTWPYVSLLGFFGVFVALNGGVVLGDKANHVATLHFTQMLYIWPFFAFFLAPLLVPAALQMLTNPLDVLGLSSIPEITATTTPESAKGTSSSPFLAAMARISSTKPFRPLVALGTVALFALVIRFNTIIHPFTLADNRHYMFYIFRHFIRRSAALRLALAVSYALCLRLSWAALFNPSVEDRHLTTLKLCRDRFVNHPFLPAPQPCPLAQEPDKVHPNRTTAALVPLDARESRASEPVAASTALLAIAASALSLVTAPLVEPRYFIVPWMVWRLLVPAWTPRPRSPSSWTPSWLAAFAQKHDVRLFAETAWFAAVNLATMFVFVAWPYVWRAEDGALLDGGRVQHFMW